MNKDALMIKFKYPAECMQNFYRMRLAVPSQDFFYKSLYSTIICYTRDKTDNFIIILPLFINFFSKNLHLF